MSSKKDLQKKKRSPRKPKVNQKQKGNDSSGIQNGKVKKKRPFWKKKKMEDKVVKVMGDLSLSKNGLDTDGKKSSKVSPPGQTQIPIDDSKNKSLDNINPSKKSKSKKLSNKQKWKKKKKSVKGASLSKPAVDKTSSKKTKEPVSLPSKPEDFDANWKKLLQTMPKDKPAQKKRKTWKKPAAELSEDKTESSTPDIWFDDVDDILIESLKNGKENVNETASTKTKTNPLVKPQSFEGVTKVLAMDCEMVGVGEGGKDSILARVSIVNQFGQCVYDKYVKPTEPVTDYRTHVSGIRPEDLLKGLSFKKVQKEVSDILSGKCLVGHAIENDLKVLFLSHPRKMIRDTVRYKPFRTLFNGRMPSLKKLTEKVLSVKVQEGEHDSVQDAQAAMRLYTMHRKQWEKQIRDKSSRKPVSSKT